jgi:hypothetical protein
MSDLKRMWFSIAAGFVLGSLGSLPVMIFGPLAFPLSLGNSGSGEHIVLLLLSASFLCFGILGFLSCWRVTQRFVENSTDRISLGLGSHDR